MFKILETCPIKDLQKNAEILFESLEKENAEEFIRTLFKRVPELTVEEEKTLHRLGRKVLKKFNMKPIRN